LLMHAFVSRAHLFPQSIRFLLAGGFAAGVNWLVRFPLSAFLPFVIAVVLAAMVGMLIGFLAYRAFVFTGSSRSARSQIRDFLLVNAATLAIVAAAAIQFRAALLLVMPLYLAEAAGHAAAIAVGAVANYLGHSAITFQNRPNR
jgi:energy-coupling factor transport system substrate-specific component